MLVIMKKRAAARDIDGLARAAAQLGYSVNVARDSGRAVVEIGGDEIFCSPDMFNGFPAVEKVVSAPPPFKLVARSHKPSGTEVKIGTVRIGRGNIQMIAGPCSIESEAQAMRIAKNVAGLGIKLFRGGAFKPRTSPYSFQGLSEKGLHILKKAAHEHGMYAVTELTDVRHAEAVGENADVVQIGTRNATNYPLLSEAGKLGKPILLKRGISSTIREFLLCAEYIMSRGNGRVILCERGIRTFETAYRSTLDIAAVSIIKELSHLPVIVDPSHASGAWNLVSDLSLAAIAAGADGVMIEVHDRPEEALSDSRQSLKPKRLCGLMGGIARVAACLGRRFAPGEAHCGER